MAIKQREPDRTGLLSRITEKKQQQLRLQNIQQKIEQHDLIRPHEKNNIITDTINESQTYDEYLLTKITRDKDTEKSLPNNVQHSRTDPMDDSAGSNVKHKAQKTENKRDHSQEREEE